MRQEIAEPEIHHGDALVVAETLGDFDYVITDPPYSVGGQSSLRSVDSVRETQLMMAAMGQSLLAGVLRAVRKRPSFSAWVMTDWRQVSGLALTLEIMGLRRQSCIVWDKQRGSLSGVYHPSHEMIVWASNSKPTGGYLGRDLISVPRPKSGEKDHAFAKPVELVAKMCAAFPPGRVLDPFCGSGGLLVGAANLGWEVVGIDTSLASCERARQRLSAVRGRPQTLPTMGEHECDGSSAEGEAAEGVDAQIVLGE